MCDTIVATPPATGDRGVLFAKNSDREPGEAQGLELVRGAAHPPGSRLRATHLEIPQAARTHGVLLSRPFWMWGAEMGANDRGVVAGNEAVFTRVPVEATGLLGMDLVRLALERSASARDAVEVVAGLLEEHGQGGPAGYRDRAFRYHNSFLLADPEEAWVLETAGRAWAAKRVSGVRSLSNGLSLRDDHDRCSEGLAAYARDRGLHPGRGKVDFAATFGDPLRTFAAAARRRAACTAGTLGRASGPLGVAHAFRALRDHGTSGEGFRPARGLFMTVCVHASWPPTRAHGQTVASWVSSLGAKRCTHWVTGTSAPCTSVFKPVWIEAGLPDVGPFPGERYDGASLWWRHERVHRWILGDYARRTAGIAPERDLLEARSLEGAAPLGKPSLDLSQEAFRRASAELGRWEGRVGRGSPSGGPLYRRYWDRENRLSGLP